MGCGGFSRRDISLARFRQNNPGSINFDGTNTYTVVGDVTVPFLINISMKADELLIINGGVTFTILGAVSNFEADEYTTNSDIINNLGTINMEDRSGICFGLTGLPVSSCIKNQGTFNKNGGEITINLLNQSEGIINEAIGTFNFNKGPYIVKDMSGGTSSIAIQNLGDFNVTGGSISIPDLSSGAIGIQYDSGTFAFTSSSITIGNIQGRSNGILGNGGTFTQDGGAITIGELNNLGCRAIQIYDTFTKNGGSINIGNIGNSAIGIEVNNTGNFIQTDGVITIGDISNASRGINNEGTATIKNINIGNISLNDSDETGGIFNVNNLQILNGNINIKDISGDGSNLCVGVANGNILLLINSTLNLGNIASGLCVGVACIGDNTTPYQLIINNSHINILQINDNGAVGILGGLFIPAPPSSITLTNNSTIEVTNSNNIGSGFSSLDTVNNGPGCTINMNNGTGYTPYNPDKSNNPPWVVGGTYLP